MTIKDLIENWENYDIYYAGISVSNPTVVMFDAKIDGQSITPDKWIPVTEMSVLATLVGWLDAKPTFPPVLWRILGPDGKFYESDNES